MTDTPTPEEPTSGAQRPVDTPAGRSWLGMTSTDFDGVQRRVQTSLFPEPDGCGTPDLFDTDPAPQPSATPEPCSECDADDSTVCGCCPECLTTKLERCVWCGACRCDRHDDCVRPTAVTPTVVESAVAVLAVEHQAVTLNEYGRCTGAGYRVVEGADDRARVSHQAPPVDLLDPDRPSSEERWEEQRRAVDAYASTLEAAGWVVERKTVVTEPIALAKLPEDNVPKQRIEIGVRVSGEVRGQAFTGTVSSTSSRDGSSALRDGRLVTIDPGVLEHVLVATDNELTTPAGRRVRGVHLRGAEEIAGLVVLTEAPEADRAVPELHLVIRVPEPYAERDVDRMDVAEALEAAGWVGDEDNPLGLLRLNGAVWAVLNEAGDSGLTCPNGANLEFPSDAPAVVVVAACLAAAASAAPTGSGAEDELTPEETGERENSLLHWLGPRTDSDTSQ